MSRPKIVVFAIGNDARGDDALGPRIGEWLIERQLEGVEVLVEYQLQVEHALDLREAVLVLFIDAAETGPTPLALYRLQPDAGTPSLTHALSPPALLAVFRQIEGRDPPPAFILAVRGECFELGAALSPMAQMHYEAAIGLLQELLADPDTDGWFRRALQLTA